MRYKKNFLSVTPRTRALEPLSFILKNSAEAFWFLFLENNCIDVISDKPQTITPSVCLPTYKSESNNREKGVFALIINLRNPYNPLIPKIGVQTIKIGCFSSLENDLLLNSKVREF